MCGVNACLAVVSQRPDDVRRVFVTEELVPTFKSFLHRCAKRRVGYHITDLAEIDRFTGTLHHEGVCMVVRERPAGSLRALVERLTAEPDARALVVYLDRVQNPHNLGAIVRVCAYFGAAAVVASGEGLNMSSALVRIAQGGAEWVDFIPVADAADALAKLKDAGLTLVATSPRGDAELQSAPLPARAVIMLGSERHGLEPTVTALAERVLRIPGSGQIESLNVACAASVVLAEHWRAHPTESKQ